MSHSYAQVSDASLSKTYAALDRQERSGLRGFHAFGEDGGDMERVARRAILDLMPAGGAVGDNKRRLVRAACGRQQRELRHGDRSLIGVDAITEGAGHPAATGLDGLDVQAGNQPEYLLDGFEGAE